MAVGPRQLGSTSDHLLISGKGLPPIVLLGGWVNRLVQSSRGGGCPPRLPWGGVRVWAYITTYGDFDPDPPDPPHPPKGLFWRSKRGWG